MTAPLSAGWESQGPAQGRSATAPDAAECDDAESWLSENDKALSSRTEPQTNRIQEDLTNVPIIPAGVSKSKARLDASLPSEQ